MMQYWVLLLAISIFVGTTTNAYQQFQTYIPNGDKVPNPCPAGSAWPGVGHQVPGGGGQRNPFGLDFDAKQHNWTAVCPLDSDKDGRTNGQELGDPNCTWKTGMAPPSSSNLTHPGICEPLNSATCSSLNSWLQCPAKFNCPAINNSDVRQLTLRFPPTPVPANETTYNCYGFQLPNDTDYHIIAMTPIVNTSQILHHMLLFVCDELTDYNILRSPQTCGMAPTNCNTLIGVWAVGTYGQCNSDQFGFLIGANGFKYAILQLHWNNPRLGSNYMDSSGMTLYFTPKLRPNSGAVLIVGQVSLDIPPGLKSVSFNGTCPKYCTSALPQTLYMTSALLHMHLLGTSGDIQLYRNGMFNRTLVNAPTYDYNLPSVVEFPQPITLQPGDELLVDCTFDSSGKTVVTHFGESTQDEMCYGFFTYYPINKNFLQCAQWRDVATCSNVPVNCGIDDFITLSKFAGNVCKPGNCSRTCHILMMALVDTGCMTGSIGELITLYSPDPQGMMWLAQMAKQCGVLTPGGQGPMGPTTTLSPSMKPSSATSLQAGTAVTSAILLSAALWLMHL